MLLDRQVVDTTSVENIARNQMFGKLKKVEWISKIELPKKKKKKKKKEQISICFTNATVDFNYAAGISESEKLIQEFSEESRNRKLQRRE